MTDKLYFASEIIDRINLDVVISENGIRQIIINKKSDGSTLNSATQISSDDQKVINAFKQLEEYFSRQRKVFDLPLQLSGTEFQMKVWNELTKISYGEIITYGELANRLGDKNLMRAVAAANGANPIPIIIPCHRVIGSDGNLTGYGGGLKVKQKLLELEGSWSMNLFA